ncbi:MAG: hypothetical protein AAGK17_13745 [Pseudomonadota bacterium]
MRGWLVLYALFCGVLVIALLGGQLKLTWNAIRTKQIGFGRWAAEMSVSPLGFGAWFLFYILVLVVLVHELLSVLLVLYTVIW